jgi:hypothetical protein
VILLNATLFRRKYSPPPPPSLLAPDDDTTSKIQSFMSEDYVGLYTFMSQVNLTLFCMYWYSFKNLEFVYFKLGLLHKSPLSELFFIVTTQHIGSMWVQVFFDDVRNNYASS